MKHHLNNFNKLVLLNEAQEQMLMSIILIPNNLSHKKEAQKITNEKTLFLKYHREREIVSKLIVIVQQKRHSWIASQ